MRPQLWLWGLVVVALVGCGRVGVSRVPPVPTGESFERGLMAYVRGDLEQAQADLVTALGENPYDWRAIELLHAMAREQGRAVHPPALATSLGPFEPLSPELLLRLVLGRNPDIRKALWQVVEARARLREAHVSFSPEFAVLTRFHPLGVFVALTDMILDGLQRRPAAIHQAEAALLAAVAGYARVRTAVLERALTAYLDLLHAQALVEPLEAELQARQEQVRLATPRARSGSLLRHELLALEQGVTAVQQKHTEVRGQTAIATATLNGLMGRDVQEPLPLLRRRIAMHMPAEVGEIIAVAQARRPELDEAQARVAEARGKLAEVAKALPRVELRGTYGVSTSQGRGDFLEGVSVGGRLAIPLLFWPLREARTDREAAFVEQLEVEVARLMSAIAVEAVVAHEKLALLQAELRTTSKQIEVAREALRAARALLQQGAEGDPIALKAAEAQYAVARQRLMVQDYNVQRAALQAQRALGLLPEHVALVDAPLAEPIAHPASGQRRALWVWRPTFLERAEDTAFFLDFAEARTITTVFLFTSTRRLSEAPQPFRLFLRLAHQRGLRVHALNGEPAWGLPEQRGAASTFLTAVLQYNRAQPPEARFDAVHLDVEPHTLPAWKAGRREELSAHYLAFLRTIQEQLQADGLPLVVDVPPGFERVVIDATSLLEAVLALADQVVVMAYRNRADKVIAASQAALGYAVARGKTVWVGISADPADLPDIAPGQTAEEAFEELLQQVDEGLRAQSSLQGIALHDYDRWRRLILATPAGRPQTVPEGNVPAGHPRRKPPD